MNPAKILIVDDNKDLARGLEVRLRANNYEVFLAENSATALAVAKAEHPIAIILDLSLAEEDGVDLLRKFQGSPSLRPIRVIVMTADLAPSRRRQVIELGAWSFLGKPCDYHFLLDVLHDIQLHPANPVRPAAKSKLKMAQSAGGKA